MPRRRFKHRPAYGTRVGGDDYHAYVLMRCDRPLSLRNFASIKHAEAAARREPWVVRKVRIVWDYDVKTKKYFIPHPGVEPGSVTRFATANDAYLSIPERLQYMPPSPGESGIVGTWM